MIANKNTTEAVWETASNPVQFSELSKDITVDVAIIGAGITGLTTAYQLLKTGLQVVVIEQKSVGMGTTGSSTGNLYAPIDERLFSIESKHDEATMKAVAASRIAAIDLIEKIASDLNIACDFTRAPWHLFENGSHPDQDSMVMKEFEAAKKIGLPATNVIPDNFPLPANTIVSIANQAQFNPLKYVQGLAAYLKSTDCAIYENTKALEAKDGNPCKITTNRGTISAKKIVMATHTPKGIYGVHTAMQVKREYAMAVKIQRNLPAPGVYWHALGAQQYSIRPYKNEKGEFLLVLGEPHKVGEKENNETCFQKIEDYIRKHFSVESIAFKWAAQNYKPADNIPYIGSSPLENNTYIATGFAADGLVYGTLAGTIISDLIAGKENKWAEMYDPKRFTPVASATSFVKENFTVAKHLLKDYIFYGQADALNEIKPGEGKTIKLDDERLAAYRDESGTIHTVSAICPHMGCVVHWNNAEKSWDCPCHGSRFSFDGEVLEGPAFHNLAKPNSEV